MERSDDGTDASADPWEGSATVADYFGAAFERVNLFRTMLVEQGVTRGLIGPREVGRLWERHLLNSAAVEPFLGAGSIADVGAGAGLPGIVVAAMRPQQEVILIEPMERRTAWLDEVVAACELSNVTVRRARAEELHGAITVDNVTARAVASVDKLVKWCAPLLSDQGRCAFLKGKSVHAEVDSAKYVLRKHGLSASVHQAAPIESVAPTTVLVLAR